MSKRLDVEQLKSELDGFPGKTFPIYCTELTELIDRLEAAESKLAEFYAWVERFKGVVNGGPVPTETISVQPATQAAKDLHELAQSLNG